MSKLSWRDLAASDDRIIGVIIDGIVLNGKHQCHKMAEKALRARLDEQKVHDAVKQIRDGADVKGVAEDIYSLWKCKHGSFSRDDDLEDFKKHLMRYLGMFVPGCGFRLRTTDQYSRLKASKAAEDGVDESDPSNFTSSSFVDLKVIATRDFKPGEIIHRLAGDHSAVLSKEISDRLHSKRNFSSIIHSKQGDCLFLGPARFVNHDCKPNVQLGRWDVTVTDKGGKVRARVLCFKVIRKIQTSEEIVTSYGKHYFGAGECLCRSCEAGKQSLLMTATSALDNATSWLRPRPPRPSTPDSDLTPQESDSSDDEERRQVAQVRRRRRSQGAGNTKKRKRQNTSSCQSSARKKLSDEPPTKLQRVSNGSKIPRVRDTCAVGKGLRGSTSIKYPVMGGNGRRGSNMATANETIKNGLRHSLDAAVTQATSPSSRVTQLTTSSRKFLRTTAGPSSMRFSSESSFSVDTACSSSRSFASASATSTDSDAGPTQHERSSTSRRRDSSMGIPRRRSSRLSEASSRFSQDTARPYSSSTTGPSNSSFTRTELDGDLSSELSDLESELEVAADLFGIPNPGLVGKHWEKTDSDLTQLSQLEQEKLATIGQPDSDHTDLDEFLKAAELDFGSDLTDLESDRG